MNGGGSKQTTTTNNAPWKSAQPVLETALKHASKEFMRDPRGEKTVYTGSTVIPWSQQTQQGMDAIQGNAAANAGGLGLSGQYQDIINRGGMTGAQRGVMQNLQAMPGSGLTAAQSAALRNTQRTANSNFDINANPAFQDVLRQAQTSARDAVNMSAGGAGRYGGAVHQGNLASEVGDLTARMVGNEYQNWQNRRDAANSNLFNMGQTGLTNRMNTQNAINSLAQQGIGNLGTAYQGMSQPAQDLMQVGSMNEDLATRQMNDKLRVFNDKNNATWNQISRLNAIASGAGSLGGTQTTAAPGQNPWLTGLGYGMTGLGLLGGML
jgi:polyhydroxyalkanoate synthesis regulator phasin